MSLRWFEPNHAGDVATQNTRAVKPLPSLPTRCYAIVSVMKTLTAKRVRHAVLTPMPLIEPHAAADEPTCLPPFKRRMSMPNHLMIYGNPMLLRMAANER